MKKPTKELKWNTESCLRFNASRQWTCINHAWPCELSGRGWHMATFFKTKFHGIQLLVTGFCGPVQHLANTRGNKS